MRLLHLLIVSTLAVAACNDGLTAQRSEQARASAKPFTVTPVAEFDEPWAMTFLPDGRALVTEKEGALRILNKDGTVGSIAGTPEVAYAGQGGLGDVVLHPQFAGNGLVYLSWAEAGEGGRGAAVGRGKLVLDAGGGRIDGLQVIWRQSPKVDGNGHYSHRLAFSRDGYLFITSGDRQKMAPAQAMTQTLGKVIRLTDSGAVPPDNPFSNQSEVAAQVWALGIRNGLGLAFDSAGRLWEAEMGPQGGDEVNLIERGKNYGWPIVSNGDHYRGAPIPDHPARPEFAPPKVWWDPSISPSSLMIYSGDLFPQWKGSAFIGALSGQSLIRVALNGNNAAKADRWNMDARIREVEQGPDGAIYVLEDGPEGRLLKLTPAR